MEPLPGYWDITGAPDIYIEFSVGTITKKTARIGTDSYSEIFNEVVGTVRGEDLTQRSIQWKIMDEDDNDDDVMFECIMTLTGDEIRRKDVFIFDAAEDLPPGRTGQEGTVNADARCLGGQIFWSPFEYLQLRFTREAN